MSVLDHMQFESLMFLRGPSCLGSFLSVFGLACLESFLPALDLVNLGSSPSLHALARPDFLPFVYGVVRLSLPLSTSDFIHSGFSLLFAWI